MGFFGSLINATVKVALTPVAIVKDGLDVIQGQEPETTGKLIDGALDDVGEAFDNIL